VTGSISSINRLRVGWGDATNVSGEEIAGFGDDRRKEKEKRIRVAFWAVGFVMQKRNLEEKIKGLAK